MADPITGIGTKFRKWDTASGAWSNIAQVTSITGPTMTRDTYDTTTLDTTGGYRTFIAGLRTGGTITLTCNFTRDAYDVMKADFESDVKQNYEIVLPDTDQTSFEFEGLVTECPLTIPEEIVTFDVTIQISGEVTVESGSGS